MPATTAADPRCYAHAPPERQRAALQRLVAGNDDLMAVLTRLRGSGLPDAWLVSGAIYGSVWNALTGRPPRHGIKDYDLIYFDASDLSWEAEDRQIRRLEALMAPLGLPVELRNQARVHLWYPERFGGDYPRLSEATQSLSFYAARTHSIAVRLDGDDIAVAAPFGLGLIFDLRIVPNPLMDNRATYREKGARALRHWPELIVEPWPDD